MSDGTIERIAMLTVHTSPLEPPGSGDAGGLNVYVLEAARAFAARGVQTEIFTRATGASLPPEVDLAPGITVRHVVAGPFEGLGKHDLPGQLCAFTAGVMRAVAERPEGHYDVVHSHYWLSGQVGWLAADRWDVPLVHTMHTMARVKNASLAAGDSPEPTGREIGEAQVVEAADRLVANTDVEAAQLVDLYGADPRRVRVVPPGVDLALFDPAGGAGSRAAERPGLRVGPEELLVLFVGRIQPLKAPDLLVAAAADLVERRPDLRGRLRVAVAGGPSGAGRERPDALRRLVAVLGVEDVVRLLEPLPRAELARWYRAADVVAVPSHNESFGLVALEALASGTPVLAADVGELPTAVGDGGVLVPTHRVPDWSRALEALLDDPAARERLAAAGVAHAAGFGWDETARRLLHVYGEAVDHRRSAGGPRPRTAGAPS